MTLSPGSELGNYQIVEKIGAGGMGSVYKAYQAALGRYVAIKVLPPQTAGDPSFAERFALEARAIGKLRHPNIVTAYDFAQQGDLAFLVSDFIDGGTLADQLGAPLPLDYALTILTPIAAALDYAHARGVVHRDIKPQNILLSHEGTPVLTDFGLAKIIGPGSGVTQAGALMGTAEYIAPECASGAEVAGPAADQYAVAIVAYQMLVGRHPFPSDNPISALMAHVHKPVPVPSSIGVPLPPHVEVTLLRGLAKKPEERFARISDFVRALASPAPFAAPSQSIPPSQTSPQASLPTAAEPPKLSMSQPPSLPPVPRTLPPAQASLSVPMDLTPEVGDTKKSPPWWRSRKVLLVPALIVALLVVLAVLGGRERGGGTVTDDHGNTFATATQISAGTRAGTIAPAGDVDLFRLNVPANTSIVVELHLGTLPRGSIALVTANGQILDEENDVVGRVGRVNYTTKDAGAYFIRVSAGRSDATGTYSMVVTTR
ncbi:MAG TPA: protein kinase [Candidatus Limnocylindria bacterium]|jgi:serine/threonine protein kinase|nr:protein kinase [Candidatus Limnocylindria bacterium]